MLKWAIIFAVIALVAGVLGFGGVAAGAPGIAKILFVPFLIGAAAMRVLAGGSRHQGGGGHMAIIATSVTTSVS